MKLSCLELTKEEFTLITKTLCGKLRDMEIDLAYDFGVELLEAFNNQLMVKHEEAEQVKAQE